jgi:hypothetical protein
MNTSQKVRRMRLLCMVLWLIAAAINTGHAVFVGDSLTFGVLAVFDLALAALFGAMA